MRCGISLTVGSADIKRCTAERAHRYGLFGNCRPTDSFSADSYLPAVFRRRRTR